MRTTLTIDDDVLAAAKAIAEQEKRPLGKVVSELARRSLRRRPRAPTRNGIPLLPARPDQRPVTLATVKRLGDDPA
jgi:hypothetical protein